jgi:DNA-directed RNA polymerase sigma subunit (sigma70/sigma32)
MNKRTDVNEDYVATLMLYEENVGLAGHLATKYARKYPRVDLQELIHESKIALWRAAQLHNPRVVTPGRKGFVPFGPYAMKSILWALWGHIRKHGFAVKEKSLDAVAMEKDGEEFTWLDVHDNQRAAEELSSARGDERRLKLISDLRDLIDTLPTLTDRERKVLRYQLDGFTLWQITKKVRVGYSIVSTVNASGARKLKKHIRKARRTAR